MNFFKKALVITVTLAVVGIFFTMIFLPNAFEQFSHNLGLGLNNILAATLEPIMIGGVALFLLGLGVRMFKN